MKKFKLNKLLRVPQDDDEDEPEPPTKVKK